LCAAERSGVVSAAAIASALGGARREGGGWRCLCPAHEDRDPSLSVTESNGKILVICRAGCDQDAVIEALKDRGLWPEAKRTLGKSATATYDYRDADGSLRYQVVRYANPKTFKQRRPDGADGWIWKTAGVEPLPYLLPELIKSGERVVFVAEGERDCDRLAALGEIASCNHGGAGKWSAKISPHFAGRDIVILPDNDEAGRAHAESVARSMKAAAKRVRVLALPSLPDKGDVSDWIAAGGTADELHRLADATPDWEPAAARPMFNPRAPLDIARAFSKRDGARPIVHHAGSFYEWIGTHYDELDDADVEALVYPYLDGGVRETKDGTAPFLPERADVEKVIHALRSAVHLSSRIAPPTWLKQGQDATPLMACANGLLRLSDGALLDHSADFFNMSAVEFAYDSEAPPPNEWLAFLASLWPDDPQSIAALQEMFGYIVAGEQQHQKMFLLVGPPRSGKGTIGRVLTKLVGPGGHVGLTLGSLAKNFGLAPLINKSLVIVPDARLRGPSHEIVERLLAISGGDALTIDRKYKPAWTGRLPARFVFLTNEVPALADNSGAIASRFIILELTRSFLGMEDLTLDDKLAKELPGILNWAITGWRRLAERGRFIQPARATASARLLDTLASPVKAFLDECCEIDARYEVRTKDLFGAWIVWCDQNGREHPGKEASFGRDLRAARPEIYSDQVRIPTDQKPRDGRTHERVYRGLRLRQDRPPEPQQAELPIDGAARAATMGPPEGFDERG
jgi:putative DNA primase/helicase